MVDTKTPPATVLWILGIHQWGEAFEETARHELAKQTTLNADCGVRSFYRSRDYQTSSDMLFEDKLFVILQANNAHGQLANTWSGGQNAWMTIAELQAQSQVFAQTYEVIDILDKNRIYTAKDSSYSPAAY